MTDTAYARDEWARITADPIRPPDTDEEPWPCASEPCTCLPERSGAVIVWVLAALLALLVVGGIVWAWPRG